MITCPKCHYKRTAADTAPDWQCPSCGVVYAKVNARPREAPEESMATELTLAEAQHNPLIRYFLIGAAVIALVFISYKWLSKPAAPKAGTPAVGADSAELARAKATLQIESVAGYLNGGDGAKALPVLNALAAENNPRALFHLARLYYRGYGVTKDQEKGLQLYKQSADLGEVLAEVDLGQIYEQGWGVPKAYGQAASWYQRAARGDYAPGLACLGNLYARGWGVNPNPTMAYMLYEMATISHTAASTRPDSQNNNAYTNAGCGSFWSGSIQTELAKKMSLVQVQRAKDLAKTWNFDQPIPE